TASPAPAEELEICAVGAVGDVGVFQIAVGIDEPARFYLGGDLGVAAAGCRAARPAPATPVLVAVEGAVVGVGVFQVPLSVGKTRLAVFLTLPHASPTVLVAVYRGTAGVAAAAVAVVAVGGTVVGFGVEPGAVNTGDALFPLATPAERRVGNVAVYRGTAGAAADGVAVVAVGGTVVGFGVEPGAVNTGDALSPLAAPSLIIE